MKKDFTHFSCKSDRIQWRTLVLTVLKLSVLLSENELTVINSCTIRDVTDVSS